MAKLKVMAREELCACRGDQREELTSPYTMTKADHVLVAMEGSCIVKLPLAATCNGYSFYFKRLGADWLEIQAAEKPVDPDVPEVTALEHIEGEESVVVFGEKHVVHLYSDGTGWLVLGSDRSDG